MNRDLLEDTQEVELPSGLKARLPHSAPLIEPQEEPITVGDRAALVLGLIAGAALIGVLVLLALRIVGHW